MRLSTWCVCGLAAVFALGAIPAALAQYEMAASGLQLFRFEGLQYFHIATFVHGAVFDIALPLATLALCLALVGEARNWRPLRVAAAIALITSLVSAIALTAGVASALTGEEGATANLVGAAFRLIPAIALSLAVLLLAALAVVIAVAGNLRVPAILFAAPSLLALGYGQLLSFILHAAGDDTALSDTYVSLAVDHASGISILFSMVGVLACWAMLLSGRVRVGFCLVVVGLMFIAAYFMLAGTAQLGLNGMPRRYMDYTRAFDRLHGIVAIAAASLGAILIAAIAWLASIARFKSRGPRPEEFFE